MVTVSGERAAGVGPGHDDVPDGGGGPPPFAWRPVGAIAGLAAALLAWAATRYGFFGDELYYRASGDRLGPSFGDNGPGVPAIAHLMDVIAPDSLLVLRLPAVLLTVVGIAVTALVARELGGGPGGQALAAAGYATGLFLFGQGAMLSSNVVDVALWTVVTWLVVRWTRVRSDRLLFLAALVTAAAFAVKWLIPFLWVAIAVSVLAVGPRAMLRRPALWAGAAVVLASAVPSLVWQAQRGWPQLGMSAIVGAEQDTVGGRWAFLPFVALYGGLLGTVLLVYGTWRLLRAPGLRPYRFLGLTVLVVLVLFVLTNGRPYYAFGVVPVAMAAGAVELVWNARRPVLRWVVVPVAVVSAALAVSGLPWQPAADVRPAASTADVAANLPLYGKFGWPQLAAAADAAARALPPDVAAQTVVLTPSYWTASAIDQLGHGLPVYGTGRGFRYLGVPPDSATSVLWVGQVPPPEGFTAVRRVATGVGDPRGVPGDSRDVSIWFADGPREGWAAYWAEHDELGGR